MTLTELAAMCEGADVPSYALDKQIGAAVTWPTAVPPSFTASLDAAMKLLPVDFWMEIRGPRKYLHIPTTVPNFWSVTVSRWNHEGQRTGWGATPALALCAAALRAREAQAGRMG